MILEECAAQISGLNCKRLLCIYTSKTVIFIVTTQIASNLTYGSRTDPSKPFIYNKFCQKLFFQKQIRLLYICCFQHFRTRFWRVRFLLKFLSIVTNDFPNTTTFIRRVRLNSLMRLLGLSYLSVRLSVYFSAYISLAPTRRICLKFGTGKFYENLSRNFKFR